MIKKTITYEDFNGVSRTETFYFHFSQAEILEMEMGTAGGFAERIQKIVDAKDQPAIIKLVKDFVLDAYGEKSADGKRFMKSEEIRTAFVENPAFSEIFMELATDAGKAAEFVNGVVPDNIKDKIAAAANNK